MYLIFVNLIHIILLLQSVDTNLRRSTRKRRVSVNLGDYIDSTGSEDNDLMVSAYKSFYANLLVDDC